MKKIIFQIFAYAIILSVIISCSDKNTNSPYGSISGIVYDQATNLPISGVEITTYPATSSTISNINGKFSFDNVNPGDYTLKATKIGYLVKSINISVLQNNNNNVEFYLVPSSNKNDSTYIPEDLKPFTLIYLSLDDSVKNSINNGLIAQSKNIQFTTDRHGNSLGCSEFLTYPSKITFDYNKLLDPDDFSYCYWVYINDNQSVSEDNKIDIVSRWGNYGIYYQTYAFGITTDFKPNYLLYSSDAKYSIGNIPQTVSTNQWVHIAVTYTQSTLNYYLNGVKVSTINTVVPEKSKHYGLSIGSRYDVSETQLSGKIDDFWMFSKALTDDEVDIIYNLNK